MPPPPPRPRKTSVAPRQPETPASGAHHHRPACSEQRFGGGTSGKGAAQPQYGAKHTSRVTLGGVIEELQRRVCQQVKGQLASMKELYKQAKLGRFELERELIRLVGTHVVEDAVKSVRLKIYPPETTDGDSASTKKQLVLHAYNCNRDDCSYGKACVAARENLGRLQQHVQICHHLPAKCKLCYLWNFVQSHVPKEKRTVVDNSRKRFRSPVLGVVQQVPDCPPLSKELADGPITKRRSSGDCEGTTETEAPIMC